MLQHIPSDFLKIVEKGEYLEREIRRHKILFARTEDTLKLFEYFEKINQIKEINSIKAQIQSLRNDLSSFIDLLDDLSNNDLLLEIQRSFDNFANNTVNSTLNFLSTYQLLCHKPIDIQSTDGGSGVGTSEKLVQVRLAEYFIINDLDLQARIHLEPGDSRMRCVERIMTALNEAAGDGSGIPIQAPPIFKDMSEEEILSLSQDGFRKLEAERNVAIAKGCATTLKNKYDGKRCNKTSIKAFCSKIR